MDLQKKLKKYLETLVETVILLALIATAVALAIVLTGHGVLIEDENVKAVLWYLVVGEMLYVAYKIYALKLNQK